MKSPTITRTMFHTSYEDLKERSRFDVDFIVLTASAAAICTFGFRMNSPSVIVGAMVISPLLIAIVATSASLYWKELGLFSRSISTLCFGTLLAIGISTFISVIFPISSGTEIISRISTNVTDYFYVALLSGFAGTFAFFWPKIIEAIAGIAISVALIPPIVMVGIGIGTSNPELIFSSLNIVFVNIIGILIGSFAAIIGLHAYTKVESGHS